MLQVPLRPATVLHIFVFVEIAFAFSLHERWTPELDPKYNPRYDVTNAIQHDDSSVRDSAHLGDDIAVSTLLRHQPHLLLLWLLNPSSEHSYTRNDVMDYVAQNQNDVVTDDTAAQDDSAVINRRALTSLLSELWQDEPLDQQIRHHQLRSLTHDSTFDANRPSPLSLDVDDDREARSKRVTLIHRLRGQGHSGSSARDSVTSSLLAKCKRQHRGSDVNECIRGGTRGDLG